MIKSRNLLSVLLLLPLCSCVSETQGKECELVETNDTLSFALPEDFFIFNYTQQVFKDEGGNEYLALMDRISLQLLVYDLKNQNLERKLYLWKEGPNGIGQAVGFLMKGWNEIYVPGSADQHLYVIDTAGVVREKYDFSTDDNIQGMPCLASYPLSIIGNRLYCYQNVRRNHLTGGLAPSPSEVCVDLKSMESKVSDCLLPQSLQKATEGRTVAIPELTNASRVYNGQNFVYAYQFSHNLEVQDTAFKKVGSFLAKSKYIGELSIPDISEDMTMEQMVNIECTAAFYGNLIHDPYRHLYYRFVYPETELDERNPSWIDLGRSGRNLFSVMVLGEDFKVLGETLFPRDMFNSKICFQRFIQRTLLMEFI